MRTTGNKRKNPMEVVDSTSELTCGSCIYGEQQDNDLVSCCITSETALDGRLRSAESFCGLGQWLVPGPEGIEPCDRPTAFFILVNKV